MFFTKCGVSDQCLGYFPIILEKIINKRNANHLSIVHKNDVLNTNNIQIITR